MRKWFRFIRRGHLMVMTLRKQLEGVNERLKQSELDRHKGILDQDKQFLEVRQLLASQSAYDAQLHGRIMELDKIVKELEKIVRPIIGANLPQPIDRPVPQARSMAQFNRMVTDFKDKLQEDLQDVSHGKIG